MVRTLNRREFMALASVALARAQERVSRPEVSTEACPLVPFAPVAKDGYRGQGILRQPPGTGRFPAVVSIHPGLTTVPEEQLRTYALGANASRFLAAGYVVLAPTYRSRDVDPQSQVSRADSFSVVEYARQLPYVDRNSIVVFGCSGGGDLALEIAAATSVRAIVAEEPASLLMAGIFNVKSPKQGERFSPSDSMPILEQPEKYYTAEYQKILRAKITKIRCPVLIIQGSDDRKEIPINHFNARVLYPELRTARKDFEVLTYAGEPHCFCQGEGLPFALLASATPAASLKAFRDSEAFCRRHLATKPKALDSSLVRQVPV
jgi:dipeptidyl aminopeptidase/acylaminoacyl peptidase